MKTDDEGPVPEKKVFQNPEYNSKNRTFKGTIDWTPTTMQGGTTWEYFMTFSEDLKNINRGEVVVKDNAGVILSHKLYGKDLFFDRMDESADQPQ